MKNPFIKYLMKEKKEDIFHSSGYGKAQSAEVIGTASTQSFADRMKIDKNRQIVRGYNDSRIANGMYANGPRAKQYVPPEKKEQLSDMGAAKTVAMKSAPKSTPAEAPKRNFAPPVRPKFGA